MRENIVLIGAGSASFTRGLLADLIFGDWDAEIRLCDIDPEALSVAEGIARKMIAAAGSRMTVVASTGRRDLLPGATAVICTVGVGGRRAWEKDVFVPRRHGIFQPVGDTVMPGGTSRALRMIPPMVAVAKDVLDLAPQSLFFNYGNPMAPVCRAIRKETGANVIGLCHGVFHVAHYLAHVLGVEEKNFAYASVGMNHLTWFVEARTRGADAMPRLKAIADERLKALADKGLDGSPDNPFSWHLLKLFGAFPAVLDRHVSEFFPQFFRDGTYYGKKLGVDAFSFEDCIAGGDRGYEEMKEIALSGSPLPERYIKRSGGEHEQVTDIIRSIRQDRGEVYSVNLPNDGQLPNLPAHAVVESPGVATSAGLKAILQPPLPPGVAGTLATRLQWVETTVEAAVEASRDKFVQALVIDGAVGSLEIAEKLADEMLREQAEHLPQFRA
ncbi:MAG TPA: hypothetical protein PL033_06435 [Candidatus Brocadiia bacterium]|nr:hypothetical protein [Candidatus Brocadiia bacterium]